MISEDFNGYLYADEFYLAVSLNILDVDLSILGLYLSKYTNSLVCCCKGLLLNINVAQENNIY